MGGGGQGPDFQKEIVLQRADEEIKPAECDDEIDIFQRRSCCTHTGLKGARLEAGRLCGSQERDGGGGSWLRVETERAGRRWGY